MATTERLLVRFEGGGEGSGPLSWGQRHLWAVMRQQNTWLPLHFLKELPAGTGLEEIAAQLRFLMSRYPTLRTRLRLEPDLRQVVDRGGEIALEIVEAADDQDPDELVNRLRHEYKLAEFDFVNDWPIRMTVIRHRGRYTHLLTLMCHLVLDGAAAAIMMSELNVRHAVTGETPGPTPLEQARWQASPAGQRHNRTTLKQWERRLRSIPARRFAAPVSPTRPRYWQGRFSSRALHLAVRAIADRRRADTAPVLLACHAVALARVTGTNPVVTTIITSNRFRAGLARTVSPISQEGLLVVDVGGAPFDEVLNRVRRGVLAAFKYAYYDPAQLAELVARLGRERGEDIDLGCNYNDRRVRQPDPAPAEPVPSPDQVRAALPESTFVWQHKQDGLPYEPLFVFVENTPGTQTLTVNGDTRYLAPAGMEACVRTIEDVAVAVASSRASTGDDGVLVSA
jgi:hypothetical protein